jgi:hypothetical protein
MPKKEEFRIAVLACPKHHFDNHVHCGNWCNANNVREEAKTMHNNKIDARFKQYHKEFRVEGKLVQLFQAWDTNVVKTLKKLVTKFLKKDWTCGFAIENMVRMLWVLGLQRVGFQSSTKACSYVQATWKDI